MAASDNSWLICVMLMTISHMTSGQLWCHQGPTPFQKALDHLSLPGPTIPSASMEKLRDEIFNRFDCINRYNASFCDCLGADDMRRLLEMGETTNFNEENFNRASVMLIETSRDLEGYCTQLASNDPDLTYETFEHMLASCPGCHDHEHEGHQVHGDHENYEKEVDGHDFSASLLEEYVHVLNVTYMCLPHLETFSGEAIFHMLVLQDGGHGIITKDDLPQMAAAMVIEFIQGGCLAESHWHPDEDDFLPGIFETYANKSTCNITHKGLDAILQALTIAEYAGVTEDGGHEHSAQANILVNFWSKWWNSDVTKATSQSDVSKYADDDHDHEHVVETVGSNVSVNCYSTNELLETYHINIEAGINREIMMSLCPALLQQTTTGCRYTHSEEIADDKLTTAQIYGYGTLAVLVESLCAFLGIIIIRWKNSDAFKYIIVTMLGLSVGTLVGDTILHLIPIAIGIHDDSEHAHETGGGIFVEMYTWKMTVVIAAIWLFFMMQQGMESLASRKYDKDDTVEMQITYKTKGNGIDNAAYNDDIIENGMMSKEISQNAVLSSKPDVALSKSAQKHHGHSHGAPVEYNEDGEMVKAPEVVGWMVFMGDTLHNFADGMAIGAAFSSGWRTGLSTTIAVFCHELPHEFGDIAAILSTGWSAWKVVGLNLLSALTAFLGLYIGIPVSKALDAETWILSIAAGMFLYVSLANIVPELLEFYRTYSKGKMFLASNIGMFIGYLIMLLIAIFEHSIKF